jgi:tetratricopeptide (TPR) repeat protein
MSTLPAVIIPLAVPEEARGLGLGLAALVHGFGAVGGESIPLAQLMARSALAGDPNVPETPSDPVEAFIPPQGWKEMTQEAGATNQHLVITGAFEPPTSGRGQLQLLAFHAADGSIRGQVEASIDDEHAGLGLVDALESLCTSIGGSVGPIRELRPLAWDALESILRAERCALPDPLRGGPHDRFGALVHLGRAVYDAPQAVFPARRLASIALEIVGALFASDPLVLAAVRAIEQAMVDAPNNVDLLDARTALALHLGDLEEVEARAIEAIAVDGERPRIYAFLAEARRRRGDLDGATTAIEQGLLCSSEHPLLNTERGMVLFARGAVAEAERAWRMVLDLPGSFHPPAFTQLAASILDRSDTVAAANLIDETLARTGEHPAVLKNTIQLALATEPSGMARAARVGKLAQQLVHYTPNNAWANYVLARALEETGDRMSAARRLALVEALAPESKYASEAQRARLAIESPELSAELEAVFRAANDANESALENIAARARRLAIAHEMWLPYVATGIAEARLGRWKVAHEAFTAALAVAPGCANAHLEIVGSCIALNDSKAAVEHAKQAYAIEGRSARTLAVLASALFAAGESEEAKRAIAVALEIEPTNESNLALNARIAAHVESQGGQASDSGPC